MALSKSSLPISGPTSSTISNLKRSNQQILLSFPITAIDLILELLKTQSRSFSIFFFTELSYISDVAQH